MSEDLSKLKQGVIIVLKCFANISSMATVINPIFGMAGTLMRVVLQHVDNEDICMLKREFANVTVALDKISQQNCDALERIKKDLLDDQYSSVENNLRTQFRVFMEMVEAPELLRESRKEDFKEKYVNELGDQNLQTLYDGVMGKPKAFSQPILPVYLEQSRRDRVTMEQLCKRLTYLFCIGLTAFMGYSIIIGNDMNRLKEKWEKQMNDVQEKMQEALDKCK